MPHNITYKFLFKLQRFHITYDNSEIVTLNLYKYHNKLNKQNYTYI